MKNSGHTLIIQLLSKLYLVTYTREKDELFGRKRAKFEFEIERKFQVILVFQRIPEELRILSQRFRWFNLILRLELSF